MSNFAFLELSRFLGRPVRLFEFRIQDEVWRFAQSTSLITTPGDVLWYPAQIERDEIRVTPERAKDRIGIRMSYLRDPLALEFPSTQPIGDMWHPYIPSDRVLVTCYDWHVGAEDAPKQVWDGVAKQPRYTDVEFEVFCVPEDRLGDARNQGPKWQPGCPKTPYSTGLRGCNLDPDDYEVSATLSDVDGLVLTSSAFASAPFSLLNGEFRWERDVTLQDGSTGQRLERRTIVEHDGADVRIVYGGIGLAAALEGVALPSCPGTHEACMARNNLSNYGGSDYMPLKDPAKESQSWL